ncbi:DUF4292 domain-containing protein [Robiginitalea sp. M366]|uniref:DUF4292 domain-containing protein n=1 Tax=Robiginitalea aestuariiviva TaxID=3036903 RepID=UPI00240E746E|nr:DUF4292 domain-containing protein [Robiginitalea aestuariiviva]MDG1571438.1 DUF4292 domain-containing protein [Robiginitalea aestuariiviva]
MKALIRNTIWMLTLVFMASSCGSTKVLGGAKIDPRLTVRNVIRNHMSARSDFKTLSGRMGIDYSDGEAEQSVTVSFRMKRNEIIWLSAPLGVVKVYITPTRVSFYNKLENEFFDGDFDYLSGLLGSEIDFEKLQNLLLGQAVVDLREAKYDLDYSEEAYELKPRVAAGLYKLFFQIEPSYFRLASQQLSQPEARRLMEIRYSSYQQVSGQVVPDRVHIAAIEADQRIDIGITYKQVEINRDLRFPYRIPKGLNPIAAK